MANKENSKSKNPDKIIFIGSKLEAESTFRTPRWSLSYNFPWNPDPLCNGNNYDIYDEMIDDDQIKSALSVKKDMVVNTGWEIDCEDEKVKDGVTKALQHINESSGLDTTFDDILRDMLSSYDYGFSLSEPVYMIKDGIYWYKSIKTRVPHGFRFILDDAGNVIHIIQETDKQGDKQFKPNQFIHHVYNMKFGNPYGTSDLRSAYNNWIAKKFIVRMFAIYVERYASGTIVAKYPKNAGDDEINKVFEIAKSIQNTTSLAIPDDYVMDVLEAKKDASDIYLKALDYYNMMIARSVLVPDLLGLGGSQTSGGSFALGEKQFEVFLGTIKKDRSSLEKKVTMKLIRPLVMANWGDIPCVFKFIPYSEGDTAKNLDIWVKAVSGQSPVYKPTDEEINHFRKTTGFPEGDVNRSEPIQVNPNPEPNPPKQPKNPIEPKKELDAPEGDEDDNILKYQFRDFTSYEKKVDFQSANGIFVTDTKNQLKDMNVMAEKVIDGLIKDVKEKNLLNKLNINKIDSLKAKNTQPMAQSLKKYYDEVYIGSTNLAKKEVKSDEPDKFAINMTSEEFLKLIESEAFSSIGDYATNMTKQSKNIVRHAIKDGLGTDATVKLLKESLEGYSDKWLNTVVRTKTTEIYNEARKRYWETDEFAKQIIVAYQWSSILDDRTSEICRYMDGKIFGVAESESIKPPAHFNCRSVLVPITRFEDFKKNPKSDFTPNKLTEKGGTLLFPGSSKAK